LDNDLRALESAYRQLSSVGSTKENVRAIIAQIKIEKEKLSEKGSDSWWLKVKVPGSDNTFVANVNPNKPMSYLKELIEVVRIRLSLIRPH